MIKEYKDYSVLGHLDSMVRYDKCGSYPFDKIKGIVEKILIQVIKDGKGIELNTSSRRYGLSDLTPSRDILKLYRQLGGTVITIGSDSHKAEHINDGLDQAKVELKNLGFDKFCTFENMKPIYHDL